MIKKLDDGTIQTRALDGYKLYYKDGVITKQHNMPITKQDLIDTDEMIVKGDMTPYERFIYVQKQD